MEKKVHYVTVTFLNGKKATYRMPRDLQAGLDQISREEARQYLQDALVVVPMERYTEENKGHPRLELARVSKLFQAKPGRAWRTRSQFVTRDNWTQSPYKQIYTFIRHDHKWSNKLRIAIQLWKWRKLERN